MPTPVMIPGVDPLRAQQYKTQRGDSPEDLWQPLYDRANIATTVTGQTAFFSTVQGQSATLIIATAAVTKVKTYRDTNMQNANVVPTKLFKIVGISLGFVHATRAALTNTTDRSLILDGSYFQFRIVDKDILFLPSLALPIINPWAMAATTANNSSIMGDNPGGGQGVAMYKLPIPITINPYENFQCSLVFDLGSGITLSNTLDVYCILHAFQRRPT